jgi:Ca2+-binding RTX toxin-like protein
MGANIEQVDLLDQATTVTGNALDNFIGGFNNNVSYHLDGGAGNDTAFGAGGDDFLIGGTGNDELFGGEGADHMTGGVGDDTYGVDNIGDVVTEAKNGGIDTIDAAISVDLNVQGANIENLFLEGDDNINGTGNELDNWMIGSRGNNTIVGAGGNDTLDGHQGDDILAGGSGNDILEGGTGKDTMSGDAGNDVFLYRVNDLTPLATLGGDTINNFESGKDRIDIHDLFERFNIDETKNPFADGHLALIGDGQGNTLLIFDADGTGTGAGITLATIHQQPIAQTDIIY